MTGNCARNVKLKVDHQFIYEKHTKKPTNTVIKESILTEVSHLHSLSGYYAYIETSSPRRRGDIANLMSGPFSGVQCLKFAYSMVGRQIGTLKVFLLLHGNKLDIWSKTGEQRGSDWKTDNVTLYGNNYYVSRHIYLHQSKLLHRKSAKN